MVAGLGNRGEGDTYPNQALLTLIDTFEHAPNLFLFLVSAYACLVNVYEIGLGK